MGRHAGPHADCRVAAAVSVDEQLAAVRDPHTVAALRRWTDSGDVVLEIGCGPGQYREAVRGRYLGVDITAEPYRSDLPRDPDIVADAAALPLREGCADVVFFSNTFYNLASPSRALAEAKRVLRRDGRLLIFDYSARTLRHLLDRHRDGQQKLTVAVRTCGEWRSLLVPSGWRDVEIEMNSRSLAAVAARAFLPTALYGALVDRRKGGVIVTGTPGAA
jgi:SAM-dependent methyltransferase